jgi:hypothetical protein
MARNLLVAAAMLIVASCGSTSQDTSESKESYVAEKESSCVSASGEEEGIDGTEPAYPIAIGPDGPVSGLKRELDGSALYISDAGVCSVAETAPDTWATTGIVVDEQDEPVADATVTFEALEPAGLHVFLVARTDEDGAFAFVNVPVKGDRSCYRERIQAEGFVPFTSVEVFTPQTYAQSASLSRKGYFDGLGTDRRACVAQPPAD